jgi:hypothetical protein
MDEQIRKELDDVKRRLALLEAEELTPWAKEQLAKSKARPRSEFVPLR